MIKKILLLLFFSSLVFSCATKQRSAVTTAFEKIIFHSSACFGDCPIYQLEIKNDKTIKLITEKSPRSRKMKSDTIEKGVPEYMTGAVNDSLFNQLTSELHSINLENIEFDGITCCDRALITIITYKDGKRKFLQSMFPPEKASRLIELLNEICKSDTYQKSDIAFSIEAPSK